MDKTVYQASITAHGEAVTKNVGKHDLTIENTIWLGTMTILKVDGDFKEPLAEAEFTLTGSDGTEVVKKTGALGKVVFEHLTYGVTYTWKETKSPKGYLLDEANTGTWSTVEITAEGQRRPGCIAVTKQDMNGEPLAGVTFLPEYNDGGTWKPVTVHNGEGYTLPKTGGTGTKLFYIFGVLGLMAGGAAIVMGLRKRRNA